MAAAVRDLLLDRNVFWVVDQTYLIAALATGLNRIFRRRALAVPPRLFLIPDAIGLALFTIVGTQIALQWHTPVAGRQPDGMITGVIGGGSATFCNDVPMVFLKGRLYASAAWAGALAMIGMQAAGVPSVTASWLAMALVLILRLAAIRYHLTLPHSARNAMPTLKDATHVPPSASFPTSSVPGVSSAPGAWQLPSKWSVPNSRIFVMPPVGGRFPQSRHAARGRTLSAISWNASSAAGPAPKKFSRLFRKAGAAYGLEYAFEKIRLRANTLMAHRPDLPPNNPGRGDTVVERLFQAQFQRGEHVGDLDVLCTIAEACGLPEDTRNTSASDADSEVVREDARQLRALGISMVPTFICRMMADLLGAEDPTVLANAILEAQPT